MSVEIHVSNAAVSTSLCSIITRLSLRSYSSFFILCRPLSHLSILGLHFLLISFCLFTLSSVVCYSVISVPSLSVSNIFFPLSVSSLFFLLWFSHCCFFFFYSSSSFQNFLFCDASSSLPHFSYRSPFATFISPCLSFIFSDSNLHVPSRSFMFSPALILIYYQYIFLLHNISSFLLSMLPSAQSFSGLLIMAWFPKGLAILSFLLLLSSLSSVALAEAFISMRKEPAKARGNQWLCPRRAKQLPWLLFLTPGHSRQVKEGCGLCLFWQSPL